LVSIINFVTYYQNGLGLAYNDARSHLDIGRRAVEGLKPGLAQIGSVWLPLPHVLMIPTIWNDFMWHTGLAGAIESMVAFVLTGILIYQILKLFDVDLPSRLFAVLVFVANLNILYLQSTAMTELLLMGTMTAACYYLIAWFKSDNMLDLIKGGFWTMMASLVRYDGWFLLLWAAFLVFVSVIKKRGYKTAEGKTVLFLTLAGFGVILWLLWNLLIFKDPFYFAFGPFSAHAQQQQLLEAGNLSTKGNLGLSTKIYLYALFYNTYTLPFIFGMAGLVLLAFDRKISANLRLGSLILLAPLFFNIIALYLGHSVLFIQGISGNTWFNVRYGILFMPSLAIYLGYIFKKAKNYRYLILGIFLFITFFAFANRDAVTVDDARVGSSGKNVTEVSNWLRLHALNQSGLVLVSAASHDAIIFSSGLPMRRIIHEGTGDFWLNATSAPDRWARWIIMRTYDKNDLTFKLIEPTGAITKYTLVQSFPFADIYELKPEYLPNLQQTYK
jgi:hypothetical protein